ncbi:MAG TPA: hypothetical protein VFQ63_03690, partial [Patescibacteria group bacterium]|nr:hypothetical protein [Patescibacteria group bacterium]
RGVYGTDISISYHELGNPSLNTGVFAQATKKAAIAYKADHTRFSVNGSSGSNFIVLRALKHQLGVVNVLAQRNVHKSISLAAADYRININYLSPHYDNDLQIFIPNTIDEILQELKEHPETNVLLITNPTYEGLSLDLKRLVKEVRKVNDKIIIFIDEAWGAHFPFSAKLPVCAMEAGADICVQSTHKQGSGLQQTGMIHWKNGRIKKKYIEDSYKSLMTTSPSFHLLASLDGARYLMETKGEEIITGLLRVSQDLIEGLTGIQDVVVVEPSTIMKRYPQVHGIDRSKILVNVSKTGCAGFAIAHHLEKDYKIIVEKYEANNLLFLTTFQNNEYEVKQTLEGLKRTLEHLKGLNKKEHIIFPEFPVKIKKRIASNELDGRETVIKSLEDAVGHVSGEDIVPYPPGIPLVMKGEEIQKVHIDYLESLKKTNGLISVVMSDDDIKSIVLIKE